MRQHCAVLVQQNAELSARKLFYHGSSNFYAVFFTHRPPSSGFSVLGILANGPSGRVFHCTSSSSAAITAQTTDDSHARWVSALLVLKRSKIASVTFSGKNRDPNAKPSRI